MNNSGPMLNLRETPSRYSEAFTAMLKPPGRPPRKLAKYPAIVFPLDASPAPGYPPSAETMNIEVFCSIIHVESALHLLWAEHDLKTTRWHLGVSFHQTSSQALGHFQSTRLPALVTVTEGTAERLQQAGSAVCLLEAPPGKLRWTSPHPARSPLSIAQLPGRGIHFIHTDHPTDIAVFEDFQASVARASGMDVQALHLQPTCITEVPERRDIYDRARLGREEFLLTNSFMDRWALQGEEPTVLSGWEKIERRFFFANRALLELRDRTGRLFAPWLQAYLKSVFWEMDFNHVAPFGSRYRSHGIGYLQV